MSDIVLSFDAPADPLSMNEGTSFIERMRKQAWRDAAYYRWIEAHPGVGPEGRAAVCPAEVHVTLGFTTNRRRDPINYARTVKHIVDGLVLAGAWPDDTDDYVTQHIPTLIARSDIGCVVRVSARAVRP